MTSFANLGAASSRCRLSSSRSQLGFDPSYFEEPSEFYLQQGDVIAGVPFVVGLPEMRFLSNPKSANGRFTADVSGPPDAGSDGYAVVQVSIREAVILTYDCDLDRGLESIVLNDEPLCFSFA